MNYLSNCLCKCCSLILSEHYWSPCNDWTHLMSKRRGNRGRTLYEPRTGQRSAITLALKMVNLTLRRWQFNQRAWQRQELWPVFRRSKRAWSSLFPATNSLETFDHIGRVITVWQKTILGIEECTFFEIKKLKSLRSIFFLHFLYLWIYWVLSFSVFLW